MRLNWLICFCLFQMNILRKKKYVLARSDHTSIKSILFVMVVLVLSATFNNMSVISWRSVLLVEETGVPEEYHRPAQVIDKLYHIIIYFDIQLDF